VIPALVRRLLLPNGHWITPGAERRRNGLLHPLFFRLFTRICGCEREGLNAQGYGTERVPACRTL
jgi:hypothetical protein